MPEELPNDGDELREPPSFFRFDGEERRAQETLGELMQVRIEGVFAVTQSGHINQFVLLSDGDRKLPILIGPFEAHAISQAMEKGRPDRPLTHDLLRTIIERFHGSLERVVIDDLWNTVYYAKIYIKNGKEEFEIDARPSDAIALAVRFDAEIWVADGILEAADEQI